MLENDQIRPDERFYPKKFVFNFQHHYRHFERYAMAVQLLGQLGENELWLDCACGSGYCTRYLSNFTSKIVGHDLDSQAMNYAREHYQRDDCIFADRLDDYLFDVIFSIEIIEHIPRTEVDAFVSKMHRLLKPDGVFIATTPILPVSDPNPANEFHRYEYSQVEMQSMLGENGFMVEDSRFYESVFTDGERKQQGFFKCRKA